jgi:hypothetical protein
MEKIEPENTARMVVDACSDCDVCRILMDSDCLSCRLQFNQLSIRKKHADDKVGFAFHSSGSV